MCVCVLYVFAMFCVLSDLSLADSPTPTQGTLTQGTLQPVRMIYNFQITSKIAAGQRVYSLKAKEQKKLTSLI
jgi:hypothetical protein